MMIDKEGLWYRVFKARYGEEGAVEGRGQRLLFVVACVGEDS